MTSSIKDEKVGDVIPASSIDKETTNDIVQHEDQESQDEGRTPTDEEMKTLRHVSEKIPISCWLVAIVELSERFAYYGLSTPFQNYMQNGPDDTPKGVLSLNQQGATALSYFFQFWCYLTPILGGWIADTYWGKYKTIFVSAMIYIVGILFYLLPRYHRLQAEPPLWVDLLLPLLL